MKKLLLGSKGLNPYLFIGILLTFSSSLWFTNYYFMGKDYKQKIEKNNIKLDSLQRETDSLIFENVINKIK